ncbi:hypothetical protein LNAOJCKE_5660 [Methylorubrum aminovorans]|uniref:SIR2-like domain-containing protein n=2 Tax=Methylorubrum aminovorans TaxID=269069 RepID=A0ABQ4UPQ3_9HYPH|nr:SIR2 family protein [Methylorubrum aminovorans]GJE68421.1 hypothetical protein LNAOJCKE_5660 [Methylorubrum aminovorans]
MIDPATSLAFSAFENKGVFALLLGSGMSRASQIPTGWEIILDLTRRVGALEEAGEPTDWAEWYRNRFGKEPNYSDLLDMLSHSPDERRAILHRYIEPSVEDIAEGRKVPTRAHRAIAKLIRDGFIRVIITTNFDRLLENALRDEGVEPTFIKSDDDLAGAVPLIHSRCNIIKIHGDYLDTRIRNTEEELQGYSVAMNQLLDRVLDDHGLIVCGWSADWDHALRAVIERIQNRRYPLFWASRGVPSQVAQDLITHRRGVTVSIADADSFFERLQQKVEVQTSLNQANPRSIELMVASAKRYVAKSEFRVQLHDLVDEEARRLKTLLGDARLGVNDPWSPDNFRQMVVLYESGAEPLIKIFSALGRWGTGSELPLVTDILKHFGKHRALGGLTVYINLRTYPAVLLLYAYGIGALKAGRFENLFRWLSTPIEMENRGELEAAVASLFLWFWAGGDNDYWKHIEGYERRKTPLSDHLLEIMSQMLADLALDKDEFDLLFERFELYASLANGTLTTTKEGLGEELSGPAPHNYARIPLGRIGWNSQTQRVLFAELATPEVQHRLLEVGFGNGDKEFLEMIGTSLTRLAGRMHW